jgi:hypothetical protein
MEPVAERRVTPRVQMPQARRANGTGLVLFIDRFPLCLPALAISFIGSLLAL